MTKILTTHNAQITTAAVEVKTLTITGKMVTQSVFRQLLSEPLINEDGSLAGVPWGHVNYHPDKCGDSPHRHLHVVWQLGAELRRSAVALTPSFDRPKSDDYEFHPEMASEFYTECVRSFLHGESQHYFTSSPVRYSSEYGAPLKPRTHRTVTVHGVPIWIEMSDKALIAVEAHDSVKRMRKSAAGEEAVEQEHGPGSASRHVRDRLLPPTEERFAAALAELDAECVDRLPLDELFALVEEQVKAEAELRQRHRDSIAALAALPHLFIAV